MTLLKLYYVSFLQNSFASFVPFFWPLLNKILVSVQKNLFGGREEDKAAAEQQNLSSPQ